MKKKYLETKKSKIFFTKLYIEPYEIMLAFILHIKNVEKSACDRLYQIFAR